MPRPLYFFFIHFHSCIFSPIAIESHVESGKEPGFSTDFSFLPRKIFPF